jgi:hypothetical protein
MDTASQAQDAALHYFEEHTHDIEEPKDLLDHKDCPICYYPYHIGEYDYLDEVPVRIEPCGHIFGRRCLEAHINNTGAAYRNKCPYCRALLFPLASDREPEPRQDFETHFNTMQTMLNVIRLTAHAFNLQKDIYDDAEGDARTEALERIRKLVGQMQQELNILETWSQGRANRISANLFDSILNARQVFQHLADLYDATPND